MVFINYTLAQHYDYFPPKGQFPMEITGNPEIMHQRETNLTVVKVIDPSNGRFQYRYDIITPVVDDFHFVLALDSSSSLKASRNSEEAWAIINAVPNFINATIKDHSDKNFGISIVSWDNDTDLAYGALNNNNPRSAKLVKIQNASKDLDYIFGGVSDKNYRYYCLDEETTNLSQPIGAAIEILDRNPPIRYHRTSNFTILVVGDGEYSKCKEELIKEAQDKGYAVYAILIDYSESSDLFSHLQDITGNRNRIFTCVADEKTLEQNLELQLKKALDAALSEPVAENVTLYDHLNSLIPASGNASIEIEGFPETRRNIIPIYSDNSILIGVPVGLQAKNVTSITLDAHIELRNLGKLLNNGSTAISNDSNLSYRWLRERYPFKVQINESSIDIIGPIFIGRSQSQPIGTEHSAQNGRIGFWNLLSGFLGR